MPRQTQKSFLTPKDEFPPVQCHLFEDYNKLDSLAKKRGYDAVEIGNDDRIETKGLTGFQNGILHSGWIATMDDSTVKAQDQVETLKIKIAECVKRGETVIIGFCRTGHFSIGYTIYRKREENAS